MNYLNEIFKCINRGKINMDRGSVGHKQLIPLINRVKEGRELGRSKLIKVYLANIRFF